jgi:calcium/calmodulin-dependent protein kinase I
MELMHGGELFD